MSDTEEPEESSHKQILRSSAIIGGASVLNILIGLLRMKVVAVLLGPAGVGLIGILNNLMSAGSTIAALGFGNVGTRQIAEARGQEDQAGVDAARRALFWGTIVLALIGALAFWAARSVIAQHVLGDVTLAPHVGWVSLGIALTVATGSQRALLTGMRRIGDIARITVVSSLASALAGIAAVYVFGEAGVIVLVLSAPLAGLIISHIFVAKLPAIKTGRTPLNELSEQWMTLARLGSAFMVAGLSVTLGQLVVRSMVQQQLGTDSLGYFQAAWAISMTYIGFVLSAMGTDYYPRLTAAIHDQENARRLVNEQAHVAILLAGPVLVAMLALAPWIIRLLYTEEFIPAVTILRWQILGDVLKILSWPMGFIILACGKGKIFMVKEAAIMGVFVVATWVMLPFIGLEATGIAFFVMYAVNVPVLFFIARSLIGFSWSSAVKFDGILLVVTAALIAVMGHFSDLLALLLGMVAATVIGLRSLVNLAHMAELGGPIGKLLSKIRRTD
ncbi:MAG: O-antigen translocase [Ketobacteraceae bacterium]|nr:O-antigen translocase [Ketobacteraceae bacterium]